MVWNCLKRYRWLCLAAVALVLVEANCELLLPTLMARLIDDGVRQGDMACILQVGGQMAAAALLGIGCILIRNLCSGTASQKFGADLRRTLFEKTIRLTERSTDQIGLGSLVTRMASDCEQLARSLNSALRIGMKSPAICLGSIFYAVRLDAGLSLPVLAVVALVLGLIVCYMSMSDRRFRRVRQAMDRMNTVVQEFLRAIRLVKALGREGEEKEKFRRANAETTEAGIRLQILSAWFAPLITLVVYLGAAAILWLAGYRGAEMGTVSAFVTYMTQMLTALMTLIDVFKLLVRANTSARRVEEVLTLPEEERLPGGADLRADAPALEFRNVSFAYPGGSGVSALKGVSFALYPGETLAVIGPTGAGKSTLAWLCARLYDPDEGEICLGGRDLRELSLHQIRQQVAVAAQQSALFSGTVRDNLAMGAPEADEAAMTQALECAQALRFVEEAGGLDCRLEQGGVNFSGGQRQRLSLARALLRQSGVLILDDCTSALDTVTERQVLSALESRRSRQAVLMVTQRVQTARRADRILVLEDGCPAGLGRHAELLEHCPAYREICAIQTVGEGEAYG